MTERQFEEWLRNAAQDYNRPPEGTPREDIWAEIDEVRSDSWQRSQWREAASWWRLSRGIAATVALWVFPLAAVGAGAALAINHWASDDEPGLSSIVVEHRHGEEQDQGHTDCGDIDTKVAALNALLQMGTEQALPILTDVLERRDACSVELRRRAVFLVSQHETDETVDILFDAARTDPDFEVREQAVFWLGQMPDVDAVDALESILEQAEDEDIQKKVIFSLSQHGSRRANAILHEYAADRGGAGEVREQAIFWLGQEGASEDVEFLMNLFDDLESDDLKEKVIFSVSHASHGAAGDWLVGLAADENQSVDIRKNALFWAGEEGNVDADDLRDIYEDADEFDLREHVIFVLSQMDGSEAAADVLIDIAKNETDSELRDKALFWLGESDSPKAARFIAEMIGG